MKKVAAFIALLLSLLLPGFSAPNAYAVETTGDFNLQVTPSPLVTTVKPGEKTEIELKIRNAGSDTEQLKIEPRAFTLSKDGTTVRLKDTTLPDIADWISFSQTKFTVLPGEWYSEHITFNAPKDAGFSYSFALVISRQSLPKATEGSRVITGSLAIFTLVNVDRPGATANLSVKDFSVSKKLYEYLPATFTVRFRNSGNTIVQPYGNIFIQRGKNDTKQLSTLLVNESKGYVLPNSERSVTATWNDAFPVYKTVTNTDGSTTQQLVWEWANLSKLRIGRYTAHLVAVYNDNGRDVPIDGVVSFWVIPWKILLALLIAVLLIIFSLYTILRAIIRKFRKRIVRHNRTNNTTHTL